VDRLDHRYLPLEVNALLAAVARSSLRLAISRNCWNVQSISRYISFPIPADVSPLTFKESVIFVSSNPPPNMAALAGLTQPRVITDETETSTLINKNSVPIQSAQERKDSTLDTTFYVALDDSRDILWESVNDESE
jgi:hypothetical protein